MPRRKEPRIPDAILDQLLAGADPKTAIDPNGLLDDLKKALAERALNAEMDHHLAREETGNKSAHVLPCPKSMSWLSRSPDEAVQRSRSDLSHQQGGDAMVL